MHKFKKIGILIFSFLISLSIVFPVNAAGTDISLSTEKTEVENGEIFDLVITLTSDKEKNYTSLLELSFSADILEVASFQFGEKWTAIPQKGYDLIDNNTGILIKTAGSPGGFSEKKVFGTVSFKVKQEGVATIKVGKKSFSLNKKNKNVLKGGLPEIKITVKGVKSVIPERLFDISLSVDDNEIKEGDKLASVVTLNNFGRLETPVNMVYIIRDENGNKVYEEEEEVSVQTSEVVSRRFEDLNLKEGKYHLVLQTLYDNDVFDEFRQDFEIMPQKKEYQEIAFLTISLIGILLLISAAVLVRKIKY